MKELAQKMTIFRKRKQKDNEEPQVITNPYEQIREARMKENHERMQKLGIMDLSFKFKAHSAPLKRTRTTNPSFKKLPPRWTLRRSFRLQNATPISYSEVAVSKKDGQLEDWNLKQEVGPKPEIYTKEHEKLLGNTERSWKLSADGFGKDGKRIYDSINGKTCHQCRQKTLGYRTHCSKCQIVQGQFCGDCLYKRYGEHVLEALENKNWICPVCRGICNCSLCRQAKGWSPTGALYRKISSLGYKSVAHYLIQTRRSQNTANEVSAKRSLPFSDMETMSKESPRFTDKTAEQLEHQTEGKILKFKSMKGNKISSRNLPNDGQTKRSLTFSGSDVKSENVESDKVNHEIHDNLGLSKPQSEEINDEFKKEKHVQSSGNLATACQTDGLLTFSVIEARSENLESAGTHVIHEDLALSRSKFEDICENEFKSEEEKKELHSTDKENVEGCIPQESCLKYKRRHASAINSSRYSIAARLRQRSHQRSNVQDDAEFIGLNEKHFDVRPAVNTVLSSQNIEEENEMHVQDDKHVAAAVVLESCPKLKECARAIEPSQDSIGARLQQRHRDSDGQDDAEFMGMKEKTSDVKTVVKTMSSNQNVEEENEMHVKDGKRVDASVVSESIPKLKKRARVAEPSPDSIGARLRQRRRMEKGHENEELLGTGDK